MTHWAMLKKENSNLVALLNVPVRHLLSSLAIVPRDRSAAAKGPLVQLARSRRLPCNKGSQQMEAQMLRK